MRVDTGTRSGAVPKSWDWTVACDPVDTGRAMSQENVEAFREVIKAINERGADARLDLLDAEIEFREDPKFPDAQVYRGRDEVVRNFREFTASFDYYRFEIEDLRD